MITQIYMKKFIALSTILVVLVSCGSSDKGELVGVRGKKWNPEKPYGMSLIPGGAYIMGKSKLFKTAIIGAPLIDLLDHYLTIDGHGKSNMWRFEHDQMRMPIPFYSNEFERNSPLKNVQHISSPILTWTGSGDLQLDWKNGMKLHNALWRLDKKSTLLLYPDEGHVLADKKNQEDLSNKVKDWLDYYLKGKSKASWME